MCETCHWASLMERIEDLIETGEFGWADDTLSDIHDFAEQNGHVTEKQRAAVENIAASRGY